MNAMKQSIKGLLYPMPHDQQISTKVNQQEKKHMIHKHMMGNINDQNCHLPFTQAEILLPL